MIYNCILLRPGELALKGNNRMQFEKKMLENLRFALKKIDPNASIRMIYGGYVVENIINIEKTTQMFLDVFGISLICPAIKVENNLDAINNAATQIAELKKPETFKIDAKRQNKNFELTSVEICKKVGEFVITKTGVKAQMRNPICTIYVDVCDQNTYVYDERITASQGLPVGITGHIISLISGGIDSPVASYMTNKRGCHITYLTFESFPFTSKQATEKVKELVKILSKYQQQTTLYIVPFAEIQKQIKEKCSEKNRTILYRRMMVRIANLLAKKTYAECIITGESLAQVASQTLTNIDAIDEITTIPILRPLIMFDKLETIQIAKKIGTFETSIQPHPDCCTVFQPENPTTHAKKGELEFDEAKLELDELLLGILEKAEIVKF